MADAVMNKVAIVAWPVRQKPERRMLKKTTSESSLVVCLDSDEEGSGNGGMPMQVERGESGHGSPRLSGGWRSRDADGRRCDMGGVDESGKFQPQDDGRQATTAEGVPRRRRPAVLPDKGSRSMDGKSAGGGDDRSRPDAQHDGRPGKRATVGKELNDSRTDRKRFRQPKEAGTGKETDGTGKWLAPDRERGSQRGPEERRSGSCKQPDAKMDHSTIDQFHEFCREGKTEVVKRVLMDHADWLFKTTPAGCSKTALRAKDYAWLGWQDGNLEAKNTMHALEVEEARALMKAQDAGWEEVREGNVKSQYRRRW